MTKMYKTKPVVGEEKWVDFDEDTNCWGIFGLTSGFCYQLFYTEDAANEALKSQE